MTNTQRIPFEVLADVANESAEAIERGYPLRANVRDELARWLRSEGTTNAHAQRVAYLLSLQGVV